MKKRLLSILLVLAMVISFVPAFEISASAGDPPAAKQVTLYTDGAETNALFPFYFFSCDFFAKSQMIYPAADLTGLLNKEISSMTFYVQTKQDDPGCNWDVKLMTTDTTDLTSSFVDTSSATVVYHGHVNPSQDTMKITFTTPFEYTGGNLLIETKNTETGSYKNVYFYGISTSGNTARADSSYAEYANTFLPKVTFDYEPLFYTEGDGCSTTPYIISNYEGLESLAAKVNSGKITESYYYRLDENFPTGGEATELTTPIGNNSNNFVGYFDGNNKEVKLNIDANGYLGLFGYITEGSEIKDVVTTGTITGTESVGGVVGYAYYSTITNCGSECEINATDSQVGGVAGYGHESYFVKCFFTGTITDNDGSKIGGVVGYPNGNSEITKCYSTADVTGGEEVGGIAGYCCTGVKITDCYSTGTVTAKSGADTGGIAGETGIVVISGCYSTCDVTTENGGYTGGIVGETSSVSKIFNCYATGDVTATGWFVGGIAGKQNGDLFNCYATGDVSGKGCVGGIVGGIDGKFENCYTTGTATGDEYFGAIAGEIQSKASVEDCYYLTGGTNPAYGKNGGTVEAIYALSEAQMKGAAGATDDTWVAIGDEKIALVDALNNYVCDEACDGLTPWTIDEATPELAYSDTLYLVDGRMYSSFNGWGNPGNVETTVSGIDYNPSTHTYYFNNVNLPLTGENSVVIYGDATITLTGDNVIGLPADNTEETYLRAYNGITVDCTDSNNLTFTGDGNLTIYDTNTGISARDITFDENFTGTVTINDYGHGPRCCLKAYDCLLIKNGTFNLNSANSNGISARSIFISGGKINANGKAAGIMSPDCYGFNISGGEINAKGETAIKLVSEDVDPNINITGGSIKAEGEKYGITYENTWGADINITGGGIRAKGSEAAVKAESTGAEAAINIDGKLSVKGVDATSTAVIYKNSADSEFVTIGNYGCNYNVALTAGKVQTLILGDKDAGEYTITGNSFKGFQFTKNGKYVAVVNGKVKADSTSEYTWKYDGGLHTEVKTTVVTKTLFWSRTTVKTVKYYLGFDGTKFILTNAKTNAFVQVTSEEHCIAYKHDGDGKHVAYCTKCDYIEDAEAHKYDKDTHLCECGKKDPSYFCVTDVDVNEKTIVTYSGFWIWLKKNVSYQYNIVPKTQGTKVVKIEYSFDKELTENNKWKTGATISSLVPITTMLIRVTDANGSVSLWQYVDRDVKSLAKPIDVSGQWWDYDKLGAATNVSSVKFSKSLPGNYSETSPDWKTWDTPANSTAYYNTKTGALTYTLDEGVKKFVFDDGSLFRTGPKTLKDEWILESFKEMGLVYSSIEALEDYLQKFYDLYDALLTKDEDAIVEAFNASFGKILGEPVENIDEVYGIFPYEELLEYALDYPKIYEEIKNGGLVSSSYGIGNSTAENLTITGLDLFDVSNVTDFSWMFAASYEHFYCKSLDVSSFDVSNGQDFSYMFVDCQALTELKIGEWDTSKATDMSYMFDGCIELKSVDVSSFNTSNVTDMSFMFDNCQSVTYLDVDGFDTSKVTDMECMFQACDMLDGLDVSGFNTSNVENMNCMFGGCESLTELNVSNFDTAKVTDMGLMFSSCAKVPALDVSGFDTAKAVDIGGMFRGCELITELAVDNFITTNVTDMSGMFDGCKSLLSLNLENFNTSKVTNMYNMFGLCESLTTLDLSSFDMSKVTEINCMFQDCSKLKSIKFSDIATSSLTNIANLFVGCKELTTVNLTAFDTSKVKSMYNVFGECEALAKLDLTSFDMSSVKNAEKMFENCKKLKNIYVDPTKFVVPETASSDYMFNGCESLTYYVERLDNNAQYAFVGEGGYLSVKEN